MSNEILILVHLLPWVELILPKLEQSLEEGLSVVSGFHGNHPLAVVRHSNMSHFCVYHHSVPVLTHVVLSCNVELQTNNNASSLVHFVRGCFLYSVNTITCNMYWHQQKPCLEDAQLHMRGFAEAWGKACQIYLSDFFGWKKNYAFVLSRSSQVSTPHFESAHILFFHLS